MSANRTVKTFIPFIVSTLRFAGLPGTENHFRLFPIVSVKWLSDYAGSLIEFASRFLHTMIGTKLTHYEITDHLGSGGMGDVYPATDTRLGRSVAITYLPEAFSNDRDRVARF